MIALAVALAAAAPGSMIRFHGAEPSLKALSAEAHRCGLRDTKVERIGKFLALTVQTSGPSDPRAACVVQWVFAHPEAKIGFLGNQAGL